jgi:hypothetical protein
MTTEPTEAAKKLLNALIKSGFDQPIDDSIELDIIQRHMDAYHSEQSKIDLRPRVHGNGFIQLDISKSVRLHIFGDERIPRTSVSTQLHDHTFGFTSKILSGTLENVRYSVRENPNGKFKVYRAFVRDKEDTVLRNTNVRVTVEEAKREILKAGDSYSMVAGEFHESIPCGRVVTIITKDGLTCGKSPSVLVPIGQEPDNDFNRYSLSPEELWSIITSHSEQSKELVEKAFLDDLRKSAESNAKDRERLDWLGNQKSIGVAFQLIFDPHTGSKDLVPTWSVHKTNPNHLRHAIDTAMKGTKAEVER